MTATHTHKSGAEAGFTLVELAIVMIIVGLLIGGVLKGQELINNARVAATVTQIKGIDTAVSTFREKYDSFPGDMANSATRVPNCTASPCDAGGGAGIGNGRIESLPGDSNAAASEARAFWAQMANSDLLTGVDTSAVSAENFPDSEVGTGAFRIGFSTGAVANFPEVVGTDALRAGHYLALSNDGETAISATQVNTITPNQAAQIDRKVDDGLPAAGLLRAATAGTGPNACEFVPATGPTIYNEAENSTNCGIYVRIQN